MRNRFYEQEQQVDVRLRENEDEIHTKSYDVPAVPGYYLADCEWTSEPSQFTIEARWNSDEWITYDLSDETDGDCYFVAIDVREYRDEPQIAATACADTTDSRLCDFIDE